jgi:hypothetical protein
MAFRPTWRIAATLTGLLAALLLAGSPGVASAEALVVERIGGGGAWYEVVGPARAAGEGNGDLTPNQLFSGGSLTREEALAACGPAAAVAFARAKGKPVTLDTAVAYAREVGWTARRGMSGPSGQVSLLKSLGVPATLETGLDRGKIAREVQAGRPVIIRAAGGGGHYFVAERLDPSSGRYDFAQSALVLKNSGGRRWFSLDELSSLGVGSPTHAIFMADGGSVAAAAMANTAASAPAVAASAAARTTMAAATPPATTAATARGPVVNTGGPAARLRAAPGLDAKIIGLLPDGASVIDLGKTQRVAGRTWRNVSLASGKQAWIDDGLLRLSR